MHKAFDTVDCKMLCKLYKYGIRGIILNWFVKQYVIIADALSDLDDITCGIPQGYRPITGLLFLVYVNNIENCVPDACIKLFVDDTNVFA